MSGLSALAQTFEANSKQQASATAQAVQSALDQHEQTLIEQLRSSERTLNAAIQHREQRLSSLLDETERKTRAAVLNSWKWLAGSLAAVALVAGGAPWWTGQQIADNLVVLSRAQTLGVAFHEQEGEQYIILPPGSKATPAGAFEGRTAMKLEK